MYEHTHTHSAHMEETYTHMHTGKRKKTHLCNNTRNICSKKHTHTCTHIHTHTHTSLTHTIKGILIRNIGDICCTQTITYITALLNASNKITDCTHTCTCTHTHTHTQAHVRMHARTPVCKHIHMHILTCLHTRHTYRHIHKHKRYMLICYSYASEWTQNRRKKWLRDKAVRHTEKDHASDMTESIY